MKAWWQQLAARERRWVALGGGALTLILIYGLAWLPLASYHTRAQQRVSEQTELLAWMQQTAAEIERLRAAAGGAVPVNAQSLLARVDESAKAAGLGAALKRVEPEGSNTVRVWLEQAPFDASVLWLERLKREHGARITSVVVERVAAAPVGTVNVRIGLEGSAL